MEVMRGEGDEPPGALARSRRRQRWRRGANGSARARAAAAAAEQKSRKRAGRSVGRSRSVAALSEGKVFRRRSHPVTLYVEGATSYLQFPLSPQI